MIEIQNFIGGEFFKCSDTLDSFNPATGKVHALIPDSPKEDVQKAVEAAEKAFPM